MLDFLEYQDLQPNKPDTRKNTIFLLKLLKICKSSFIIWLGIIRRGLPN